MVAKRKRRSIPCRTERREAEKLDNGCELEACPLIGGEQSCQEQFFSHFWQIRFLTTLFSFS